MVGPCGLEPQTYTVSICWADLEQMRWSENKLHGENHLDKRTYLTHCRRWDRVGGICTG